MTSPAPGQENQPAQVKPDSANDPATSDDEEQSRVDEHPADDAPATGVTFSNPVDAKWKVGVRVIGASKIARNMLVTIPVPNDWPEQRVSMASEEIPSNVDKVTFRDLDSGVRQLMLTIPVVRAREETIVTMTFLVSTRQVIGPPNPTVFVRPKSNHKQGKPYLGVGPQINYRNTKLRKQVKELVASKEFVWQEVEAIYDWVRDNIEQRDSAADDVISIFREKSGCAEDKVGLFVAMCRANKIPARMVWVEGTQYAEFMLVDKEKNAHWFPCSVVGIREFGSISDPRIILQKGDSIRVPEKESRQKFVAEFATCVGTKKPIVRFVREALPADN
jgi:hypothetical protein